MRIGIVCPYDLDRPGGVQSQVRGLADALRSGGDEVSVIAPGASASGPDVSVGSSLSIKANRSVVPINLSPGTPGRLRRAVDGLDVLHVHEPLMPLVSLAALRSGPPVVATFHAAPGGLGKTVYRLLGRSLGAVLGDRVEVVTAVSSTAAAPLRVEGVRIIPNAIDVGSFAVESQRQPTRVCFLGRDEPRKGLDALLEAWPRIVSEVPDAGLTVMGATRQVTGVDWLGTVDDVEKARVLAGSAVYVAPNLGGESFGIVLVEAMAAGTPVVCSALPAFQEVAGDAARYFATGDSESLAATVVELLGDAPERERMSALGRERAAGFDWATVAAQYRDAYVEAIS